MHCPCGNLLKFKQKKFCSIPCFNINSTGKNNPNWKGGINKVKTKCLICDKTFHAEGSKVKRGMGKFCSLKCYGQHRQINLSGENSHLWRGGNVERTCLQCASLFTVNRNQVKTGRGKYCSKKCANSAKKGKPAKSPPPIHLGELNPNWRGGITSENAKIRASLEYKTWRQAIFERDNYTCQDCGVKGGRLNADHILPFAWFPEVRLQLDNGKTLCHDCHRKTKTWGKGSYQFKGMSAKLALDILQSS